MSPTPTLTTPCQHAPLCKVRGEKDGWAAEKGELEVEVVSSVNQARQREAQVAHLTASLDEARRDCVFTPPTRALLQADAPRVGRSPSFLTSPGTGIFHRPPQACLSS
eukprot:scaffold34003_cov79-Isochrysis_galbana.AAC.1